MNSLTRKLAIFVALVALALAATPAAFAQSSLGGYAKPGGTINERVQGGDPASEQRGDSGSSASPGATSSNNGGSDDSSNGNGDSTLPFTGSDLGLLAGGGVLLLGLGLGMRRLTRPNAA